VILVVDDHFDSSAVLVRLLARHGHDAVAVDSGTAALDWMSERRPSAVVLDLLMPDMSGFEVLETIRRDPALSDLPVLIFSGDYSHETLKRARELGVKDVLVKGTVDWQNVCDTIAKYVA
jgi:CheY-like chemotaxis protein